MTLIRRALLGLLLFFQSAHPTLAQFKPTEWQLEMTCFVNRERAKVNSRPLLLDGCVFNV